MEYKDVTDDIFNKATDELEAKLGRHVNDKEVYEYLNVDTESNIVRGYN